jgi:hypothetical protein
VLLVPLNVSHLANEKCFMMGAKVEKRERNKGHKKSSLN